MIRMFETNLVRTQVELGGSWKMWTLNNEGNPTKEYSAVVPSCWEGMRGLESFRGQCKYSKKFSVKAGNYRLVFCGVSHTANIWLDGEHIGYHYGAYTPFDIDLPDLAEGEHTIEVIADNRFSPESTLHIPNDYRSYGGITRPVVLQKVAEAYIRYIHIVPRKTESGWDAEIEVQVNNISATAPLKARVAIEGACADLGDITFTDGICKATATLSFTDVKAWCMEEPALYIARAELMAGDEVIDDLNERFGFREVKVVGKDITVNGRAVYIKGFNRHEDFGTTGCAVPENAMAMDLDIIASTGANLVRTCHYPNDERFLDLCDERGFLVWEEAHARQLYAPQMEHPNFKIQAGACIDEMIINHFNHPSIIMWGLLNECESYTELGRDAHLFHYERIRALDSSRPVTSAANKFFKDICHDLPDIISFNIYPKWYYNHEPKEFVAKLKEYADAQATCERPILISEYGAASIYGYRAFSNVKYSEDRQAQILKELTETFYEIDDIKGMIVWMYADARTDETFKDWNSRPKTQNNKGIVDIYRRPKMAYYTMCELFGKMADYVDEKEK
ncbi:MAG: beta-glucuronidase [Clostridia bacterium]|nr:beta-glucuronidase [Clostridia bacterium]